MGQVQPLMEHRSGVGNAHRCGGCAIRRILAADAVDLSVGRALSASAYPAACIAFHALTAAPHAAGKGSGSEDSRAVLTRAARANCSINYIHIL